MKDDLIAAVHNVPVLWDRFHKQHHNRHILKREWEKIASQLGTTEKHVRYTWKNLRQEFGKQLKKNLKTGAAARDELTWPYFQAMLFLTDQFLMKQSSGNLTAMEHISISEVKEEEFEYSENYPGTPDVTDSQPGTSNSNDGPSNNSSPGQQLLELEREKVNQQEANDIQNPNDEDVGFFNSLLPHVRQLTPRDKLRFRIQVQNILFDMAYPPQTSSHQVEVFNTPSSVSNEQSIPNSSLPHN